MRPFILQWEAEGLSQRRITARLNEAGAPVPSEYTGGRTRPRVTKRWSLVQYQRFRALADEAAEKMKWWAVRTGASHTRPYGDGRGLFRHPTIVGLPPDINKRTYTVAELQEEIDEFREAERMKDPAHRQGREEAEEALARLWDEAEAGTPHVPKMVKIGNTTLPHPDEFMRERLFPRHRTGKSKR